MGVILWASWQALIKQHKLIWDIFLVARTLYRDYNSRLLDAERALENIKAFEKSVA